MALKILAFFFVAAVLAGTGPSHADAVTDSLQVLLEGQAAKVAGRVIAVDPLRGYYGSEDAIPIWTGPGGVKQGAHALIELVAGAEAEGLVPGDYLSGIPGDVDGITDPAALARLELALSDMFLHYGRDLYRGRTSPSISAPDIVIARKEFDETAWLRAAAQSGPEAVYQALQPQHAQYRKLKAMLAGYRRLATAGGWPAIASGETLKPDMADPGVAELRANLAARGYGGLARNSVEEAQVFDAGLVVALKHFQDRHGLTPDAVVGPRTRAALNVPAEARVRQLIINLERLRWLPAELGERYVFVNQAGFQLWVIDSDRVIAEHKVIVGKPFHRSPMFSDRIRYLEFNPTWTVTNSIAVNEMLPKLKQNPNYLATQNMVLYSGWGDSAREIDPTAVDWWALAGKQFPFRIVQQPGPKNALGRVKFMFPNKFNVYLHDTPSRQLFNRTGRAFSHGCIRVERPLDLAATLLKHDRNMGRAEIDAIVTSKDQKALRLTRPVPVHLTYFTAWVDETGAPSFFDDIYDRDRLVARILFGEV